MSRCTHFFKSKKIMKNGEKTVFYGSQLHPRDKTVERCDFPFFFMRLLSRKDISTSGLSLFQKALTNMRRSRAHISRQTSQEA
jgi:hypothetical protein